MPKLCVTSLLDLLCVHADSRAALEMTLPAQVNQVYSTVF